MLLELATVCSRENYDVHVILTMEFLDKFQVPDFWNKKQYKMHPEKQYSQVSWTIPPFHLLSIHNHIQY